jgi:leucine-rich repeat protein SHOC2
MTSLVELVLEKTPNLQFLPESLAALTRLKILRIDPSNFVTPPSVFFEGSLPSLMRYLSPIWLSQSLGELRMPRLGLSEFPLEVELGIDPSDVSAFVRPQPKYRRIQTILLSGNKITSIPKCFEHLTELRVLDLESNALKSFPGFACTAKIECLNFSGNKLRQLPEEIGLLASLVELNVRQNAIVKLPFALKYCTRLHTLLVSHNQLKALHPHTGSLQNLEKLHADHNELVLLPRTLFEATKLTELKAEYNCIAELPPRMSTLQNLKVLTLHENRIAYLTVDLGLLTQLTDFNVEGNPIDKPERAQCV